MRVIYNFFLSYIRYIYGYVYKKKNYTNILTLMIIDVCNQHKVAPLSKWQTKYFKCWFAGTRVFCYVFIYHIYIIYITYVYTKVYVNIFIFCATFSRIFIPFLCHIYLINFLLLIFVGYPTGWSVLLAGQWGGTSYFRTKRPAYVAQGKANCHIGDTAVATDAACGLCKWWKWMKKSKESQIKEVEF